MTPTKTFQEKKTARQQVLIKTMEECGESVQACSKLLLHGPNSKGGDNIANLHEELGDVLACIRVLVNLGVLDKAILKARRDTKSASIERDYT